MNKLLTSLILVILLVLTVAFAQFSAAVYFSQTEVSLKKADLVIVFPGGGERLHTGCRVAREGFAENMMVLNSTAEKLKSVMQKQGVPEGVKALPGEKSRSTFEDAYHSARLINKHGFTSVILVTSPYHLPRADLLLKGLLAATGKRISIQCFPADQRTDMKLSGKTKLHYNEAVKLWGSAAEMLGYLVTHRMPLDSPEIQKISAFVKKHFLFKV